MTRKSKREVERSLEGLETDRDIPYDIPFAYRTTDGWVDADGEPIPDGATVAMGYGGVTVERERAEAEGWETLGPVETPGETEYVTVPLDCCGDWGGPRR